MPFVKLDCGILDSTVWIDRDQRELFITALLMASPLELQEPVDALEIDRNEPAGFTVPPGWYGFIEAAGPGIIRRAMLELEPGMIALRKLGAPDTESRTPDHDGRRLVRVPGGYLVLNYQTYRDRDYTGAERARRYRQRRASHRDATASHRDITQAEAEAEAEKDSEAPLTAPLPVPVPRGTRRGQRIDPDLVLTPEWEAIARTHRLAPNRTFAIFKNYWIAKAGEDACKLDWTRTWANWCMREAERLPGYVAAVERKSEPPPKGRPDIAPGEPRRFDVPGLVASKRMTKL